MIADAASRLASVTLVGLPDEGLTAAFRREFQARPYAGVLLFRRHFRTATALPGLIAELRALAAPRRILVAVDEEGGFVSQLAPDFPVPPNARVLGRAASVTEVERIAATVGTWLSALGVDVNFAPSLDVDSESANPVIGPRSFGSDPARVIQLGTAALRGYREGGVLSTVKHFPGHGATSYDSHLTLPDCEADEATLMARDVAPFRELLHLAPLVMTAHVRYAALDPGWPATLSPRIVTGLLRGTLDGRGVVVTDAMEMAGVADEAPGGASLLLALAAGCDLLLLGAWNARVTEQFAQAARRWEHEGESILPLARWEAARGAIEALYAASIASERADHGEHGEPADRANLSLLVPPSWDPMLLSICRRSLSWDGPPTPPAHERLEVLEPAWSAGPSIAELLLEAGVPSRGRAFRQAAPGAAPGRTPDVTPDFASALPIGAAGGGGTNASDPLVVALPRRTQLLPDEAHALHALCGARPVLLVALEQDSFLGDFPEAAGRLSACDATPAMRRAIALEIAEILSKVS
ncbi:MAG: glycoside hydrolase family 3 N-terminal domain-containing protein [Candidatus Eiseniibacteriota bacterium]